MLRGGGNNSRLGVPYKVIYSIPNLKSFVRMIAATEDRMDVRHLHEDLKRRLGRSDQTSPATKNRRQPQGITG